MNRAIIIGNLTKDPELRTTKTGVNVCSFSVAVNRRQKSKSPMVPDADYFKVTAWRELGENCAKYLTRGRKVCVVGPVSVSMYELRDGNKAASLEITAEDVEFLSPRDNIDKESGMTKVDTDDLPFDSLEGLL